MKGIRNLRSKLEPSGFIRGVAQTTAIANLQKSLATGNWGMNESNAITPHLASSPF
jgi:hypothetical protein